MSSQRDRGQSSPARGSQHDTDSPETLRSIEVAEECPPEQPEGPVYCGPQELVAVSDHRTIEIETVKLAEDIDPRKLPTELRLTRPSSAAPDSGWPQPETVVVTSQVTSQPPVATRHGRRAPLVFALLLLAFVLLVLARVVAFRVRASGAMTSAPASPRVAGLPRPALAPRLAEPPVVVVPSATVPLSAPSAAQSKPSAALAHEQEAASAAPVAPSSALARAPHKPPEAAPSRALPVSSALSVSSSVLAAPASSVLAAPSSSVLAAPSSSVLAAPSSSVLAAPSISKPKRAIY